MNVIQNHKLFCFNFWKYILFSTSFNINFNKN